jgi:hypothetical protein
MRGQAGVGVARRVLERAIWRCEQGGGDEWQFTAQPTGKARTRGRPRGRVNREASSCAGQRGPQTKGGGGARAIHGKGKGKGKWRGPGWGSPAKPTQA